MCDISGCFSTSVWYVIHMIMFRILFVGIFVCLSACVGDADPQPEGGKVDGTSATEVSAHAIGADQCRKDYSREYEGRDFHDPNGTGLFDGPLAGPNRTLARREISEAIDCLQENMRSVQFNTAQTGYAGSELNNRNSVEHIATQVARFGNSNWIGEDTSALAEYLKTVDVEPLTASLFRADMLAQVIDNQVRFNERTSQQLEFSIHVGLKSSISEMCPVDALEDRDACFVEFTTQWALENFSEDVAPGEEQIAEIIRENLEFIESNLSELREEQSDADSDAVSGSQRYVFSLQATQALFTLTLSAVSN